MTEVGDSGEELGVVSAIEAESNVEIVVVGDESVDSELVEEMLSR
jgi:predicted site-specific integrase-resolvase